MATNKGKGQKVQKTEEGKKGLDLDAFFAGVADSDEVKEVEISKVSIFHGDVTKTLASAGVTNVLKFVAPKEWTEENVQTLYNLFEAIRTKKGMFKNTDISLPYQNKAGLWCITFESANQKEFYGTEKIPSLNNTIKYIIEGDGLMNTEFPRNSIKQSKVAKASFTFSDEEGPLQIGEKGFIGFFVVNDLMKPVTVNKAGHTIEHKVSAEFLVNATGLPDNVQMNVNFGRSDAPFGISVKNFKFNDSVSIRRTLKNVLYIIALDIVDFETVEEEYETKKGKKGIRTIKYPKIGYHVTTIRIKPDAPNGWYVDSKPCFENDGITSPENMEYAIADIINSKLDKRYRTWVERDENGDVIRDEQGNPITYSVADRVFDETNLSAICARITEVLKLVEKGKTEVTGDENCILSRRVKFMKPYTLGDAISENEADSEEEEGEFNGSEAEDSNDSKEESPSNDDDAANGEVEKEETPADEGSSSDVEEDEVADE